MVYFDIAPQCGYFSAKNFTCHAQDNTNHSYTDHRFSSCSQTHTVVSDYYPNQNITLLHTSKGFRPMFPHSAISDDFRPGVYTNNCIVRAGRQKDSYLSALSYTSCNIKVIRNSISHISPYIMHGLWKRIQQFTRQHNHTVLMQAICFACIHYIPTTHYTNKTSSHPNTDSQPNQQTTHAPTTVNTAVQAP